MNFLAPLLASLFVATSTKKNSFRAPNSLATRQFLELLKDYGFILGYVFENSRFLRILLPSLSGRPLRCSLLSKPSRRFYCSSALLYQKFYFCSGLVVVSTSKGLRSAQQATLENLGGECLCHLRFF